MQPADHQFTQTLDNVLILIIFIVIVEASNTKSTS